MNLKYYISTVLLAVSLLFTGCTEKLDEEVFSQLDPTTLFTSANGVERVLFGAYRDAQITDNFGGNVWFQEEWTCDQFWETGGAVNLQATVMLAFTWDASYPTHWTGLWNNCYYSIRNCNLVIENVDNAPIDDAVKARLKAEARFVRASAYYILYGDWGRSHYAPARRAIWQWHALPMQKCKLFLKRNLRKLPLYCQTGVNYKAINMAGQPKGAALGYLTKFYLNTKQWQKCADAAQTLINTNVYHLWPNYKTLFWVENEDKQKELVWVYPCSPLGPATNL